MSAPRLRPLLWAATLVLVLALLAFLAVGANGPADPRLEPAGGTSTTARPNSAAPTAAADRRPVEGFGEIAFRLQGGGGLPASDERCALLAESDRQVRQGLMGRSDLSGYDGMIFRFAQDTTVPFFMRNVPMPLEIAWFDAGGRLVSTADMAPCPDRDGCPTYPPGGAYRYALEVEDGGLARPGIGRGSVLTVGGACPPA
jgi:uncharacterized membrane protein (UPF0127 family)